mgnify:CR=1 FL=1
MYRDFRMLIVSKTDLPSLYDILSVRLGNQSSFMNFVSSLVKFLPYKVKFFGITSTGTTIAVTIHNTRNALLFVPRVLSNTAHLHVQCDNTHNLHRSTAITLILANRLGSVYNLFMI